MVAILLVVCTLCGKILENFVMLYHQHPDSGLRLPAYLPVNCIFSIFISTFYILVLIFSGSQSLRKNFYSVRKCRDNWLGFCNHDVMNKRVEQTVVIISLLIFPIIWVTFVTFFVECSLPEQLQKIHYVYTTEEGNATHV